ncbi:MAG: cytochrome b [Gammaproteobacteria bacterium WSBS_2016_MAG_OTU1]
MAITTSIGDWLDKRMPWRETVRRHLTEYYAPKNFNIWYAFGALAILMLVVQIVSGIFLTMNYKPDAERAFASVEYIMRDVRSGWLVRYIHSTGASFFFIVVYLHMFRALIYGSYRAPRELIWLLGMMIFLAMMAEAFLGYLLPWGQTSFWGAQVIVNLFSTIPFIGEWLAETIRGDFAISDVTLNRFFALHVAAIPLLIVVLVYLHIIALHQVGSNNPDGIEIKEKKDSATGIPLDGIPFHPYYSVKDTFCAVAFLCFFAMAVFFAPEMGGYFLEYPNFEPANPLKTPDHIAPVWYFTPYYAILRAVPPFLGTQVWGVLAMGLSIVLFLFLPWLDNGAVRSIRYRGWLYKSALLVFVVSFIGLGVLGALPPSDGRQAAAQVFSLLYFAFILLMPFYTRWDKTLSPPDRVS